MDYKAFFRGVLKNRNEYVQQKANKIATDHLDKITSTVKKLVDNNPGINSVSINVGKCDGSCHDSSYDIAYNKIFFGNLPDGFKLDRSFPIKSECYELKNPGALGLYSLYTKKECINYIIQERLDF